MHISIKVSPFSIIPWVTIISHPFLANSIPEEGLRGNFKVRTLYSVECASAVNAGALISHPSRDAQRKLREYAGGTKACTPSVFIGAYAGIAGATNLDSSRFHSRFSVNTTLHKSIPEYFLFLFFIFNTGPAWPQFSGLSYQKLYTVLLQIHHLWFIIKYWGNFVFRTRFFF